MKLYKFLGESVSTHDTDEHIADMLHKECSQFFKETGGLRLFRGTKKDIPIFEKVFPRNDRTPKDTPKPVHDFFDEWFRSKFGWKVRSEGVFTSPDSEQSEHYGKVYWFLPCNGYKYVYSPSYADLTGDMEGSGLITSRGGAYKTTDYWWDVDRRNKILEPILKTYTDKNIKQISGTGFEVSFNCPKGYYLLNTGWMADSNSRYFTIYGGH